VGDSPAQVAHCGRVDCRLVPLDLYNDPATGCRVGVDRLDVDAAITGPSSGGHLEPERLEQAGNELFEVDWVHLE